jgi:hypothetical protein
MTRSVLEQYEIDCIKIVTMGHIKRLIELDALNDVVVLVNTAIDDEIKHINEEIAEHLNGGTQ